MSELTQKELIATMLEKLDNFGTTLLEVRNDVKDLRKAIYGNGEQNAGAMGRLKLLEDWKENRIWFERVIIGALVGETIGLVILALHTVLSKP